MRTLAEINEEIDAMIPKRWIDNADSYLCPVCGFEVNNPNKFRAHPTMNTKCPKCGWEADDAVKGTVNDAVNHPSHYTKGKIEVADFIADQKLNFDRGNAVKYLCRAGSKDPDKEIQDLEKAIWYIKHEIKILKGYSENGTEKET